MIKEKILFWFNAIFYIVIGGLMMLKPDLALGTLVIIFGVGSIISGITGVVLAIRNKESDDRLVFGGLSVISILVGVFLVAFPEFGETIIKIFIVLIGIGVVIRGILLFIESLHLQKIRFKKWYWTMISACLLIVLGLFLILNSLLAIFIINGIIGLGLVIAGISMIIWVLQLKREIRKELKA